MIVRYFGLTTKPLDVVWMLSELMSILKADAGPVSC